MKLLRLELQDFRGIGAATIEFGPRVTVLHGPNELGKSTLVEAVHAALFLQCNSQAGAEHVTWGRTTPACVTLTFEHESKLWRVSKRFGHRRQATLECSDGLDPPRFRDVVAGNGVEGRLRELLSWGIAPPGGRGAAPRAESFLLTALLGRQGAVQDILDASLDGDRDATGKSLVTRAIGALDKDPVVVRILECLSERVDAIFTAQGRFKTAADSPLVKLQESLRAQEERLDVMQDDDRKGKVIQSDVVRLQDQRELLLSQRSSAEADWESAKAQAERTAVRAKLQEQINDLRRQLGEADRLTSELESLERELKAGKSSLTTLRETEGAATAALAAISQRMQLAAEAVARATGEAEQSGRVREAARAQRRAETESRRTAAEARLKDVAAAEQAASETAILERVFAEAEATSASTTEAVKSAERSLEHATLRATLDELSEREDAVTRADGQLAHERERAKAASDRLEAAVAAVGAAERRRDLKVGEASAGEIQEAESELRLLQAVQAHIGLTVLRAEVQSLEEMVARARTSRADANARRVEASALEQRVAGRMLPTREQIAAWRTLEQEGSANHVPPPIASASLLLPVAAGLAAGLLVAAGAHLALDLPVTAAVFAGFVVAAIVGGLVWVDRRSRGLARSAEYERFERLRGRWTQEVEPSLRAAGLENLAAFDGAVAELEGLKADARRLRGEADQHDVAAGQAERASASLEARRGALAHAEREIPEVDAAAIAARMDEFKGDAESVSRQPLLMQQRLDTTRARLREAAEAEVRAASEERNARQADYDATAKQVAVAEATLSIARQQSDPESLARLRARLVEFEDVAATLASVADASAALDAARTLQTRAAEKLDGLQNRRDEAQADVERHVRALGDDLPDARQRVDRDLETIAAESAALDTESAGRPTSIAPALEDARNEHERLGQQFAAEQLVLDSATAQRKAAERAVGELDTAAAARRGQLTAIDRAALESRLQKAVCDPVFEVSDEPRLDSVAARGILDGVLQQLEQCTSDLNHAKGQLHLISGHVGTERLEQQEEAVRYARAEVLERERTDQAALRLLREIQKVEAERATHLGRALAGPITDTFRALTGGRYGSIAFAPDLKAQHIEVAGEPRKLEFLSVGTREQLATLLRLAIAGHLRTAVVLDDQLVHSDSERLVWFSERLRASACEHDHQVIVFTCRPADYPCGDPGDNVVTAINLESLVSR